MTTPKIIMLSCVLVAIAITLKVRLDTPQGSQPLARAIVTTWPCPNHDEQSSLPATMVRFLYECSVSMPDLLRKL